MINSETLRGFKSFRVNAKSALKRQGGKEGHFHLFKFLKKIDQKKLNDILPKET